MPKRIRDIEYDRIDRVADGAQPGAHIPLVKARTRVPKKSTKKPVSKGAITMPKTPTLADLDLSQADDATKAAIAAAIAESEALSTENATLTASKVEFDEAVAQLEAEANAGTATDDDDEVEDLSTVAGVEKAIKKTRSPEMKRILKAAKVQLEAAASDRAEVVALKKDARVRLFKERAAALPHMAAHAKTDSVAGVDGLADLLERIDAGCGSDVSAAVETLLTKAHAQAVELAKPLLKAVGRTGGDVDGMAAILDTGDAADAESARREIDEKVSALMKDGDKTRAQARVAVLKAHPDLRKRAQAA